MNYKLGSLFGTGQTPEDSRAQEVMNEEIRKVGGLLRFNVSVDADGWHAACAEIDGIMTGGKNPNPTDEEIKEHIREAIHTAFHVSSAAAREKAIINAQEAQAVFVRSGTPVAA